MLPIPSAKAIKEIDQFTCQVSEISSLELMETAAETFVNWFAQKVTTDSHVVVIAGSGNNGGDGLAISRLLLDIGYQVRTYIWKFNNSSSDFESNLARLECHPLAVMVPMANTDLPIDTGEKILIDALLGSGLNRSLDLELQGLIFQINQNFEVIFSVDIPSGLPSDGIPIGIAVESSYTFSFEYPKYSFMFEESARYVGEWRYSSIGLVIPESIAENVNHFFLQKSDIKSRIPKRNKFGHKGSYGHAGLIVGSDGMYGAAVLSTEACLRSGVGKVSVQTAKNGFQILQSTVIEAMVSHVSNEAQIENIVIDDAISCYGLGCGLGQHPKTKTAILDFLSSVEIPLVIDADVLNILASNRDYLNNIPPNSILTPHVGEFDRLFGKCVNSQVRNSIQMEMSRKYNIIIILKGAHTSISTPEGKCYFNSTGNPGMATAGSGDVLAGILTGLMAQGISALDSALIGVYLHGMAGDLALRKLGSYSLIARDIIKYLPKAFKSVYEE